MAWGRMWLHKSHPNFFFIYIATMVFHLWQGALGLFGPKTFFSAPSLARVNSTADPSVWGITFMMVGIFLLLGLFRNDFQMSRAALAIGSAICTFRATLLIVTAFEGFLGGMSGIPVWFLAAALHLSQTAEPPFNPATAR